MKKWLVVAITITIMGFLSSCSDDDNSTNPNPDDTWTKTFGGTGNDRGYALEQLNNGNFIILGYTNSTSTGQWLIEIDNGGNQKWEKVLSTSGGGRSIKQGNDNSLIIGGSTSEYGTSRFNLIKTDQNGSVLWEKNYIGSNTQNDDESIKRVLPTGDNGYVFSGTTYSYSSVAGNSEILLAKVNTSGNILWTKTYPEFDYSWPDVNCLINTVDGGYIIGGNARNGDFEILFLTKTDINGNLVWQKEILKASNQDDYCYMYSIEETTTGDYIIGYLNSNDQIDRNFQIMKISISGDLIWTKEFGGIDDDTMKYVKQTNDGGYYSGSHNLDSLLVFGV